MGLLKWVACWGNATSITDRREAVYAKNLTLRYPVRMPFTGSALRFRFSNLTGTEPVTLTKVFVGHTPITFGGATSVTLQPIYGWRTYNEKRDAMRQEFNEWLRTSPIFDGCIDFDAAVRSTTNPKAFADGFDSGDHLHPASVPTRLWPRPQPTS